jgi:hypothetical protein
MRRKKIAQFFFFFAHIFRCVAKMYFWPTMTSFDRAGEQNELKQVESFLTSFSLWFLKFLSGRRHI